jgi:hypothetical protein
VFFCFHCTHFLSIIDLTSVTWPSCSSLFIAPPAVQDVPLGEDGEHLWLGGQALAAEDNGVEVQWCMALAHQILMALEFPSVTNARVNGESE